MRNTAAVSVWTSFLASLACAMALAAEEVQIKVGESGLQSLIYKAVEYVDPAGAGALGFTGGGVGPRAAKKEDTAVFVTTPVSVSVKETTVTQTYPWGTFVAAYEAKGADLTVTATLRNTSGKGLEGWRANVLQLNDRLVFRPGGDPHGNSIHMQWSHYFELNAGARDGYAHLTQQYPHVYWWVDSAAPFDKQAVKVMFANLTGTWDTGVNRVKTDRGDRWPVFVAATAWEMAPPGQVQQNTVKVAIRFRSQDPSLRPVVDELYMRAKGLEKAEQAGKGPAKAPPRIDEERLLHPARERSQADIELDERPAAGAGNAPEQTPAQREARAKNEQAAAWAAFNAAYEKSMPSALEVCADGYEAWGRYNKREVSWTDRRPIGAFFGCPDAATSATNPNGWFKDPEGVDTTTPEGRQAFAKRLLEYVDRSIEVLRHAGAQGVIWWELEGHRYPQPHITWIADPRVLDPSHPHYQTYAPELNTPVEYGGETMPVVDACFRKWKDAGFKTGITIRPQVMTYWPAVPLDQAKARLETAQQRSNAAQVKLNEARQGLDAILEDERPMEAAKKELQQAQAELSRAREGVEKARLGAQPKEQIYDNGGKETLPKAKYARDRWGCTLFYVDSISGVFGYWAMDEAARALPDCLFLPEWATARSYRCSAQLSITGITGYRRGVPAEIQAAWPDAFCAMFHLDYSGIAAGNNAAARADLVTAVKRGNLAVFDCFYNNSDAIKVIRDVYAETGVKHVPAAKDQIISATPDQPATITLTATDEDGDALSFAILGPPAHGTLSAFDAKTGTITYTPVKGWIGADVFTFKAVDAIGLNSNRGHITVEVK
jgi:hypothetical protein